MNYYTKQDEWKILTTDELPSRRRRIVDVLEVGSTGPFAVLGGGLLVRDTVWRTDEEGALHAEATCMTWAPGMYLR